MSHLQMSLGLSECIGLLESPDGNTPSTLPDGEIESAGQAQLHANLSAKLAREKGLLTSATYGQHSFGSSASVALRSSLVSKLHQRMASDGGMLFRLTWKERVTPAGQSIYALRALGLSTSDSASTGWLSPQHRDYKDVPVVCRDLPKGINLPEQATLAGWQTPTVQDGNGRDRHNQRDGSVKLSLLGESRLTPSPWPSPNTMDTIDRQHMRPSRAATGRQTGYLSEEIIDYAAPGPTPSGYPVQTAKPGQLNAAFPRWLMGYPVEWDIAAILAHRQRKTQRKGG